MFRSNSIRAWLGIVPLFSLAISAQAAGCGSSPDPATVVNAQVDAYNAHDVAAFAACYADNIRMRDLSGQGRAPDVDGMAALKKTYSFLEQVPKDFHVQVIREVASGAVVVTLERLFGRQGGKPPLDLFAIYEVRAGKIVNVWFPPGS